MDIMINVVNQKLKLTSNLKSFVAGTQEFITFHFIYGEDWADLTTFAQFTQNGNSYNVYLDEEDSCFLPPEIVAGKCTVMLFGTKTTTVNNVTHVVHATTNVIEFTLDENMLIPNASSTEITQTLYDQLVQKVNEVLDLSDSDYSDLIKSEIARILGEYLDNGDLAAATIGDGTIEKAKLNASLQASIDKADNSWQKSVSETSTPTSGSWEATYDPAGYGKRNPPIDPYSFAQTQRDTAIARMRGVANPAEINNGAQSFTIHDQTDDVDRAYVGIDSALDGVYNLANKEANRMVISALAGYTPINIVVDPVGGLPETGADRTFYLISKGNGKYDKWWYITNEQGVKVWDNFGSASTIVATELPTVAVDEDTDYIIGSGNDYQYYKFINGEWKLIAGTNAEVYTVSQSISIFGNGNPQSNGITADGTKGYYLNIDTLRIFHDEGTWGWVVDTPQTINITPSTSKDYFIKFGSDPSYMHFRYDGTKFVQVGSSAYSKQETDELISALTSTVNTRLNSQDSAISAVDGRVSALGNMVADVTAGSTGIVVHYKDGTTSPVATKDATTVVEDVTKSEDGITISYTDGTSESIEISGGGGGGGETSGSASITRVTPSATQCVYGRACPISYTFTALDSSGDMVGDGSATWYVGGVRKATSTARQGDGVTNTFDIGEYLSVGANTVRLVVTVDTGGDSLRTVSKTWTVNAINMYLTWDYEDITINEGETFTLRLTPYGDLSKVLHLIFDGDDENEYTTTITRSGVQQAITFDALEHGSHMVQAYLTASVNGEDITSDSIYHDMIFVESGETDPVISCSFSQDTMTQYNTAQIPIVVYDPAALTSTVVLAVDGTTVATWTNVDRTVHYWNYTPNDYGDKTLTITCGTTTKTILITVEELDIDNEEVSGYSFRLKASDLTGNPALQAWNSNGVTATFSNNFDWNNGGLKTELDEDGNIRQYICVKAGTTITLNHKLFGDDPTVYGKTVKIIFKIENARNYDAAVASCYADNIGLRLFAHEATFSSTGTSVSVPYGEDEYIELEFDVYPAPTANNGSFRYIMAWIDGVITTCRVYGQSDNFTQSNQNQQDIVIGSNDCDVYIYMVKAYPNYMTRENHIVNFIADAPNAQEMVKRYDRNDILDASGEISYEKLADKNPDCRVWLYDVPYMTVGKKDKVKNCSFNQFWKNGDQYYELSGTGTITVQGTSSVDYLLGAANTDINFTSLTDGNGVNIMANGVVDEDAYGKNYFVGDTETGEVTVFTVDANTELTPDCIPVERDSSGNVTKYIKAVGYKINDDSTPITYSNLKVNFASCEQVNNMCNAIWYQRFQPYQSLTPRDCMEFAMGVQFIKDSGTVPDNDHFVLFGDNKYHMYSIGNLGNSKKNVHVFHDLSNPNECCVEVGNNLNDLCRMVDDDLSNSIWYGGSDKSFEMRYPDTDTPSQTLIDGWQRLVTWMKNSNPNEATGEQLSSPETYGNYTFVGHNRCGTQVLRGTRITRYAGTYTHDTFNRRMAKMLSECEDYLVMDSVIYHFVYLERHTMCDNVAKNTFWSSSDLLHWDLSKAYDMDTSDGNNNEGKMVFDYGNEADDVIGSKTVFNANDAVWFVFASNLYEACQTMFTNRETAGAWSASAYHNFLLEEQRKVPERVWIQCYWYDYLRTYEQGINDAWMEFLDGGQKTHQRWHYEYFEEIYDSSKYLGTSCTVQNINFRGYYPSKWSGITDEQWELLQPVPEISLKMYNKCYINISIDGTPYREKAEKGQTYTIDFSQQSKLNDTVINIYSAQMIQEIGDISRLYPGTPNFSNASRLRSLQIGSSTEGYMNSNLTGVTLGNNSMLEYLYVQNLAYINTGLDLSNCQSLTYLDASGSSFTGYEFAVGGLLAEAYIESPTSLSMRNLYYLEDENFHVTSFDNLDTLRIENCQGIDSLTIVNEATNLARARLLDIDWALAETTVLNRLILIAGLNENGNNLPVSVLTGEVYVSGSIRNQELSQYSEAWTNLDVTYNPSNLITQYKVTYVNADDNHTVLYETYVDQGNSAPDPVSLGLISTPTLTSTDQYDFTYSGWDNIASVIISDRTVTATYTTSVRTYTVSFYARVGVLLEQFTDVSYGAEVVPTVHPTWTDGESNNIYHLFAGWDKSTGYVRGDTDVFAVWDTASSFPALGTDMSAMTPAEMYGIGQAGLQDTYWEDGDYFDFVLGHDFNFSNVNDIEIGSDVTLTGIQRDTFVHGGYYFNGESAFTTNIKLFDEDSPAFTMAIDFQFNPTDTGATLISNHVGNTAEGFRFYYNGTAPTIQWGDQSVAVGSSNRRDIVVLRHPEGSRYLYVYSAGNTGASELFATSVTKTTLLRSNTTQTDEPLTFGGIHYSSGFRNYGKGTIHWCKIWLDDLGDTNAYKLATWSREDYRMEYWGKGKYYYADSSTPCKASFIGNSILGNLSGRGYYMNSSNTNVGGWDESLMRTFINNRVFNAMPTVIQSLIKSVEIRATAGNKSTEIITSFDKIYLPSYREVGSGTTANGYIEEVGTSIAPISLFPNNASRAKFKGKIRAYSSDDVTIYSCNQEPAALYQTDVEPGTLWINTSDSSRLLIFVSKDEIDQYGLTPTTVADSDYALGGWFTAYYWWERSPNLSSSATFYSVSNYGYAGNSNSASNVYGVVPSFSF